MIFFKVFHRDKEETIELTPEGIHAYEWASWGELPESTRERAVAQLSLHLPASLLIDVREAMTTYGCDWTQKIYADPFHSFHFMEGMGIRNCLRQVIHDDELPSGNWDDYYVPALEEAAVT